MATFNSQVLSAFGLEPLNLNYSLSGGSNTVVLLTVGTVGGKQVSGIAFDEIASPVGTLTTLSAFNGTTVKVDSGYNGSQMAVIFTDGSTSLFTATTSITAAQTLGAATFDNSWPEIARLVELGYR